LDFLIPLTESHLRDNPDAMSHALPERFDAAALGVFALPLDRSDDDSQQQ